LLTVGLPALFFYMIDTSFRVYSRKKNPLVSFLDCPFYVVRLRRKSPHIILYIVEFTGASGVKDLGFAWEHATCYVYLLDFLHFVTR
jgi:hypothetical protein